MSPKANPPSGNPETEGGSTNLPSGNSEAEGRRTNPPRATPKRCVPKSGSREPEGQPAEQKRQPTERQRRSGACRKAEVVSPKANPPSGHLRNGRQKNQLAEGNPEAVRAEKRKP